MRFYGYDEFDKDMHALAAQIKEHFKPDALLAIARGGLTIGHFIAMRLDMREIFVMNSIHYADTKKLDTIKLFNIPDLSAFKRVLILDDIIDSGESMSEIKRVLEQKFSQTQFKIASIFYKEKALLEPDFKVQKTDEWIEFFWERV